MKKRPKLRGPHALVALTVVVIAIALVIALGDSGGSHARDVPTGSIPEVTVETVTAPKKQPATRLDRLVHSGFALYCGGTQRRLVALTFDDGPGPYTHRIIDILRRHHAQASFFLVGNRIPMYTRLPREEATVGAVGDHSWTHADLTKLPKAGVARELDNTITEIASVSNVPVRLFRPPYEAHTPAIDRAVRARKMLEVLWSIDGRDYDTKLGAKGIADWVASQLRPGSIVVLHDIQPRTAAALRLLLPAIKRRGLRAVSVPELVRLDPPSHSQLVAGRRGCS